MGNSKTTWGRFPNLTQEMPQSSGAVPKTEQGANKIVALFNWNALSAGADMLRGTLPLRTRRSDPVFVRAAPLRSAMAGNGVRQIASTAKSVAAPAAEDRRGASRNFGYPDELYQRALTVSPPTPEQLAQLNQSRIRAGKKPYGIETPDGPEAVYNGIAKHLNMSFTNPGDLRSLAEDIAELRTSTGRSTAADGWVLHAKRAREAVPLQSGMSPKLQQLAQILGIGEGNYESYNTGTKGVPGRRVGHGYVDRPSGTVTGKTIDQILNCSDTRLGTDPNRMFAVGAYQVITPTLREAMVKLNLKGDELFTPQLQDRIFADYLFKKAGGGALARYLNDGIGTVDSTQYAAAKEWASIAVPKGYRTKAGVVSGGTRTYHDTTRANKANLTETAALRAYLSEQAR